MTAPANTAPAKKAGKVEPYTAQRALDLFNTYADPDASDTIGPDGFQQLCEDAGMPMEGARPLIFAWQTDSPEMGKITKDEWVKTMSTFKIASMPGISIAMSELEELLFTEKAPKNAGKDYDKAAFNVHAANPKAAFQKLYMFSFSLVKPEQSKNIDMETSVAFWTALLVPKYPLMSEIIDFINEHKGSYKATNKDLWSMMLEFCETVKPTLQDYEADGAWPTLLDDFVAWKTSQPANGNANKMREN
ncbi:Cullin binding-domain-containing protein, partial [Crepidotus variabilis]